MHPNDWLWEDWALSHGGNGSAHSTDNGFSRDPEILARRGIGFMADIDTKPRFRIRAWTKRVAPLPHPNPL